MQMRKFKPTTNIIYFVPLLDDRTSPKKYIEASSSYGDGFVLKLLFCVKPLARFHQDYCLHNIYMSPLIGSLRSKVYSLFFERKGPEGPRDSFQWWVMFYKETHKKSRKYNIASHFYSKHPVEDCKRQI
jgi:hypothetical protein